MRKWSWRALAVGVGALVSVVSVPSSAHAIKTVTSGTITCSITAAPATFVKSSSGVFVQGNAAVACTTTSTTLLSGSVLVNVSVVTVTSSSDKTQATVTKSLSFSIKKNSPYATVVSTASTKCTSYATGNDSMASKASIGFTSATMSSAEKSSTVSVPC